MTGDVARLGAAVREGRGRLGLSQIDVWRRGGPSNSTLTNIESGREVPVSASTLRKLDAALRWTTGTAYSLLYDENPAQPAEQSRRAPLPPRTATALAISANRVREGLASFLAQRIDFDELHRRVLHLASTADSAAHFHAAQVDAAQVDAAQVDAADSPAEVPVSTADEQLT